MNKNQANQFSEFKLRGILSEVRNGFYAVIASTERQIKITETIYRWYKSDSPPRKRIRPLAFGSGDNEEYFFEKLDKELSSGYADVYLFVNFQFGLPDDADVRRLNMSRDLLAAYGKSFIFCMTEEAYGRLQQDAPDFCSFFSLLLPFYDDLAPGEILSESDNAHEYVVSESAFTWRDWKEEGDRLKSKKCYQEAIEKYQEALRLLPQSTEPESAITLFNDVAMLCQYMEKYYDALQWYNKAIKTYEKMIPQYRDYYRPQGQDLHANVVWRMAHNEMEHGHVLKAMHDYGKAYKKYQEISAFYDQFSNSSDIAMVNVAVRQNIGEILEAMKRYKEAVEETRKVVEGFRRIVSSRERG